MARRSILCLVAILTAMLMFACEVDDGAETTDAGVDLNTSTRSDFAGGWTDVDNTCWAIDQDGTSATVYICNRVNPLGDCAVATGSVANSTLTVTTGEGSTFTVTGTANDNTLSASGGNGSSDLTASSDANCSVAAIGGAVPSDADIVDACGKTMVECSDLTMSVNLDPCEANLMCAADTYLGECRLWLRDLVECFRTIDAGDCAECDSILTRSGLDCTIDLTASACQ